MGRVVLTHTNITATPGLTGWGNILYANPPAFPACMSAIKSRQSEKRLQEEPSHVQKMKRYIPVTDNCIVKYGDSSVDGGAIEHP